MTSYIPDLARDNISFYLIPAALVVALAPRIYAANTYQAATKKEMNKELPRSFVQQVTEDQALDKETKGRILRADAAVANSIENLGIFAAAVTAGNAAGLPASTMNGLSIGYVAIRFAYNHIYIFNDLLPSAVRSLAYFGGVACYMAMFVLAGRAFNRRTLL